ncbi:MAG TPA: hypothetical protein VMG34_12060 [Bacteroidota bacterium]|nr:hypothetical protein [Bacteroidota bacterium]
MTRVEQHKLIDELRDFAPLMRGKDSFDFEMFIKRDKDDEELDQLSQQRLEQLLLTYRAMKPPRKVKNPFEK